MVPLDFSTNESIEMDEWLRLRGPEYQPDVVKVLDAGWKVSFSYSTHYRLYFLSLTGKSTDTVYDGYTISLKHPDFDRLYGVLEYVASIYLADNRLVIPPDRNGGGW